MEEARIRLNTDEANLPERPPYTWRKKFQRRQVIQWAARRLLASAIFLIDDRVLEKDFVYSGGGSPNSLIKITPLEMQKANGGRQARIRR